MHARHTAEHYNPLQLGLKRILGNKNIAFYLQRLIWSPIRWLLLHVYLFLMRLSDVIAGKAQV